jgi:hypothetical protein
MNKPEHEIDDLFQSNLDPLEMPPSKKAWTDLDAGLDKKALASYKSKLAFYQRTAAGLAILLISSLTLLYFSSRKTYSPAANNQTAMVPNAVPEKETVQAPAQTHTPSVPNTATNLQSHADLHSDIASGSLRDATLQSPSVPGYTVSGSSSGEPKPLSLARVQSPSNLQHSPDKPDRTAQPQSSSSQLETPSLSNQQILPVQTAFEIPAAPVGISKGQENSASSAPVESTTQVTAPPAQTSVNPGVPAPQNATADGASGNKSGFDWKKTAIAVFFSPDFNQHRLFDNDDNNAHHSMDHSKAKDYDGREVPDFSFSTGVMGKYELVKKWSVLAGITYSSSVHKIKPYTIYAEQGSNSEAHYLLNTSLGTAELPNAGNNIPQVGDSLHLKTNSRQILQFINIPVIVRYDWQVKRFSYYAFTGLSANILIQQQSEVSIESQTHPEVVTNNIAGLKTMTYGFLLGVGGQFNFYKGVSVFAEPILRYSMTSINQNTAVTSYPYAFGVNTGFVFHF